MSDDSVKLGDLGIARTVESSMRKVNTEAGTLYYMSPELVLEVGYLFNTDIWSMGCVLYELLFLKKPFDGKTKMDLFNSICYQQPKFYNSVFSDVLRK